MSESLHSEEEEDYMSDAVLTSCGDLRPGLYKGSKEAHKRHQERRVEKSKKQNQIPLKVREAETRDEGLSKRLDSSNKGFALLQKMGYKPGEGIGKSGEGRLEPVGISLKQNRGGLGQEAEKRKRQEQLEIFREQQHVKKLKMAQALQDNYREIKMSEQKRKRVERNLRDSQSVCEQLDHSQDIDEPLRPYYWPLALRPVRDADKEAGDDDGEEAQGPGGQQTNELKEMSKDESDEQETQEEAEPEVCDQLEEITEYLRTTHLYCIWCGYAFDDTESLSADCPGNTAEDHEEL